MKPLFGFISETYQIFGSYRTSYFVIFSLLNVAGLILMARYVTNLWQAMVVKALINISISFQNVIGEGIMVESTKGQKALAATNLSIFLSLTGVASIFSQYLGGYLLKFFSLQ
jgi:MFS family permease